MWERFADPAYWVWYVSALGSDLQGWIDTGDLPPGSPLNAIASGGLGLAAGIGQLLP